MRWIRSAAARSRLGRRGAMLLTFGILWLSQGAGLILEHTHVQPGLFLTGHIPWWLRASGWLITGLVAVGYAVRRQGRDWPGWLALYVMAAFIVAVLVDRLLETMVAGGDLRPVILSIIGNGALLAIIGIASGWREPVTLHPGGGSR